MMWMLGFLWLNRDRVPSAQALASLVLLLGVARAQAETWPFVAAPEKAYVYTLGQQITVNGLPMRLTGFESKATVDQTTQWFKDKLGKPLVESQSGRKRILGRAQEGFYITIQLEAGPEGVDRQPLTRGLIAISHLAQAFKEIDPSRMQKTKWMQALPEGSRVVGITQSDDEYKTSVHIVATNTRSPLENAQFIADSMAHMGYQLEASSLPPKTASQHGADKAPGETLLFRAQGKEAIAVIARDPRGQTSIVINTQTQLEKRP